MKTKYFAQVVQNCDGVKRPKRSGQRTRYKKFRAGDEIIGCEINASSIPGNYSPAFETKDGWLIALPNIMVLGEEGQAEVVEHRPSKQLQKRMSKYANVQGDIIDLTNKRSLYSVKGAMIGGGVMLLYAMAKGQRKFPAAMIGVILGGFVGRMFAPRMES